MVICLFSIWSQKDKKGVSIDSKRSEILERVMEVLKSGLKAGVSYDDTQSKSHEQHLKNVAEASKGKLDNNNINETENGNNNDANDASNVATAADEVSTKELTPILCKMCDSRILYEKNAESHFDGNKHKRKFKRYQLMKAVAIEFGIALEEPDPKIEGHSNYNQISFLEKQVEKFLYCTTCNISVTGFDNMLVHLSSNKHLQQSIAHATKSYTSMTLPIEKSSQRAPQPKFSINKRAQPRSSKAYNNPFASTRANNFPHTNLGKERHQSDRPPSFQTSLNKTTMPKHYRPHQANPQEARNSQAMHAVRPEMVHAPTFSSEINLPVRSHYPDNYINYPNMSNVSQPYVSPLKRRYSAQNAGFSPLKRARVEFSTFL